MVAALAAVITLQNRALDVLVEPSFLRTLLTVAAPLACIALVNFSLSVKSFGNKSLGTELLIVLGAMQVYLAVVLSILFGTPYVANADRCTMWKPLCREHLSVVPDWRLGAAFALCGVLSLIAALRRSSVLKDPSRPFRIGRPPEG